METKGVYIQDVVLPEDLVKVLTQREVARQEIKTFKRQKEAQDQRILTEQVKGTADMQSQLAQSKVGIDISTNNAEARKKQGDGEAYYTRETGTAKGAEVRAVGMAKAEAYEKQVNALGQIPTAFVNAVTALADRNIKIVPDILVTGGAGGLGSLDAVAGRLSQFLGGLVKQQPQ